MRKRRRPPEARSLGFRMRGCAGAGAGAGAGALICGGAVGMIGSTPIDSTIDDSLCCLAIDSLTKIVGASSGHHAARRLRSRQVMLMIPVPTTVIPWTVTAVFGPRMTPPLTSTNCPSPVTVTPIDMRAMIAKGAAGSVVAEYALATPAEPSSLQLRMVSSVFVARAAAALLTLARSEEH